MLPFVVGFNTTWVKSGLVDFVVRNHLAVLEKRMGMAVGKLLGLGSFDCGIGIRRSGSENWVGHGS